MKVETNDIFDLMGQYDVDADTEEHKSKKKKKGKGDKKNKSKKMEPKETFNREIENSRLEIAQMMCTVNGIDPKSFFVKTEEGLRSEPISTQTTSLTRNDFVFRSRLNWNSSALYDIGTAIFRLRFLTVMMEEVSNKLRKISKQRYRLSDEKLGLYENGYFHIKTTVNNIRKLITVMTNGIQYRNNLMICIFDSSYGGPSIYNPKDPETSPHRPNKLNGQLYAGIQELINGLNPKNLLTDKILEDDIAMYDVFRIAYMLATGNDDNKKLFSFKVIEGHRKNDDLSRIIKLLGECIYRSHHRGKPIVYTAFHEAHPSLATNIAGGYHDAATIMGIEALNLVKFVINDDKVNKFIDFMLGINEKKSLFS